MTRNDQIVREKPLFEIVSLKVQGQFTCRYAFLCPDPLCLQKAITQARG